MSQNQGDPYSEKRWKTGTGIAVGLFLLLVGLNAAYLNLSGAVPGWLAAVDSLCILTGVAAWTFGAGAFSSAKSVVSNGLKESARDAEE